MVWAAGDVVNLIELKELLEFPGTLAWSIVTSQHEWSSKFCENHTKLLYHGMCGTVWKFRDDDEFGKVVTNHNVVDPVPIKQICSQGVLHGCGGTLLTFPIGLAALELDWQIPHLSTALQMLLLIQGQNTESLAFNIHFPLLGVLCVFIARLSFISTYVTGIYIIKLK